MSAAAAPAVPSLLSLGGKVALVTGGGGGIGSAIAALFAQAGARVVSVDLAGHPGPEGVESRDCDLSRAADVRAVVDGVARDHGRLDLVVHSAGITRDGVLWKMEEAAWSQVMAVNLDAAFHLVKASVPHLRAAGGGAVVLVSSINGQRGKFGQANYAASKAGLIALGKTAAIELGRFGVRVNSIAPGLIETAMTANLPPEARKRAVDETLLGRTGTPDDVARVALFLCSDLSRHVTGQVLRVDGGQLTA